MNETPTASAPTPFPLSEWIQQIVPEVFQTMVTLEVTPASSKLAPATTDHIVGAIGLGGESVSGAIYLQLTAPLADEVTSLLLGMGQDEKPSDADVNDAIGELCNMISGGLKSNLANHGFPCAISPPAIVRGTSFSVEAPADAVPEIFLFDYQQHRLTVEVHLQVQTNNS